MNLFKITSILFIVSLIGCQQISTEIPDTGELPVSLSLQPALDNGFDVTVVAFGDFCAH